MSEYEVKTTGEAALDEMQRFIDSDLRDLEFDEFDRDNKIFHENMRVAITNGLFIDAAEKAKALTRKLLAMIGSVSPSRN